MKQLVTYKDMESISDIVMILGMDSYLKFNVKLGRKKEDTTKSVFMRGYWVPSKYTNMDYVASVKRSFDYYLTIEKYGNSDFYIQIRSTKMIIMKHVLNEAAKWLLMEDLWAVADGRLVLKGQPNPLVIQGMPPNNSTIRLSPGVKEWNGIYDKCIMLTIDGIDDYMDIGSDTFMGLLYTISSIDLYSCALTIINSIPIIQQKEFVSDIELVDPESREEREKKSCEGISKATQNRKILKDKGSFFD